MTVPPRSDEQTEPCSQRDVVTKNEWKGLASFRKDFRQTKRLNILIRSQELVFTGERDRTQLALSSSKFLCFSLIRVEEMKTVSVCFDILTLGHKAQPRETQDRNLFSEFVSGPGSSRVALKAQTSCPFRGTCPTDRLTTGPTGRKKKSRPPGCCWSIIRSMLLCEQLEWTDHT